MVDTIDVKNAAGATVTVATNDAVKTSVDAVGTKIDTLDGSVDATTAAVTSLQSAITARSVAQLGTRTVAQSPAVNIATDQPAVPVNQQSSAHKVKISFNRPADTTAYTAGDVVGGAKQLAGIGLNGGSIYLNAVRLAINVASFTSGNPGSMTLHFYDVTPPSAIADNAAWDLAAGDRASYLGFINIPAIQDLGSTWYTEVSSLAKQMKLASADLFCYLVTNVAYTPSSGETYELTALSVDI